jgi:hypothetical protein
MSDPVSGQVRALEDYFSTLRDQLAVERATGEQERGRLRAELAEERQHSRTLTDRLDQLHRDQTATTAELARVQAEHQASVAQRQAEVDRLCAELEQARLPWWRRWRQ